MLSVSFSALTLALSDRNGIGIWHIENVRLILNGSLWEEVEEEIQTDQHGSPGKQWWLVVMGINSSDDNLTETYSDNVRPSLTVFLRFVVQLVEASTHVSRPRRISTKTTQQRIFCFLFRDLLNKNAIYSVPTKKTPPPQV